MYSTSCLFRVTVVLAGLAAVNAHGYIVSWTVADGTHPGFDPSWDPKDEQPATAQRHYFEKERGFPDLKTKDTACGAKSDGETKTQIKTWPVTAGESVVAVWDQWPTAHEGPIMQYMAACPSTGCDGVEAASLPWFKISEDAWNGQEWASDTLNKSAATWTFKISEEVAPGPYLIRHEIIAMHFTNEPQVYPVCIQADVSSSGTFVPTDTVTFPEAYFEQSISNDFQTFNVHDDKSDKSAFVPPGPAVVDFSSGGSPAPSSSAGVASSDVPVPASSSSDGAVLPSPSANSSSEDSGSENTPSEETSSQPPETTALPANDAPNASPSVPSPDAQESSPTVTGGNLAVEAPAVSSGNPAQISNPGDAANGGTPSNAPPSGSGRSRGRHSRRPGQPRSCMAAQTSAPAAK